MALRRKRTAFVLSGGGNLGALQVGMLRALEAFVQAQTTRARAWLVERLAPYHVPKLLERFDAMAIPVGVVLLSGVNSMVKSALDGLTAT